MRGSLSRVRARVDRLASQLLRDGCPVCLGDEARVQVWHHMRDDPPSGTGDGLATASQTCTACGRTYALRHLVIKHELP